ncbi:hypothetical protein TNCV_2340931 [Trichonephila clavipes]|nr:hypothetical protein TNCV_2340931 [Trichonephila clavipes]
MESLAHASFPLTALDRQDNHTGSDLKVHLGASESSKCRDDPNAENSTVSVATQSNSRSNRIPSPFKMPNDCYWEQRSINLSREEAKCP